MIRRFFHSRFGHGGNLLLAGYGKENPLRLIPDKVYFYCPVCRDFVALRHIEGRTYELFTRLPRL